LKRRVAAVAMSASSAADVPSTVTSATASSSSSSAAVTDDFSVGLQARRETRCTSAALRGGVLGVLQHQSTRARTSLNAALRCTEPEARRPEREG